MKKIIEKKTLRKDKRAVSPVIAEILMVGIVVILAAVIAAFVLMIGAPERALQANLYIVSADNSDAEVLIMHQGGDELVFGETLCVWTPDIVTPSTTENGGTLVMDAGATELGSATVFEPGEFANLQNAVTLTVGNTVKLVIIHVPSGKQIFSRTVTVVA